MRRYAIRQIEQRLVDVAPAPTLGRIITLDDRMPGGVEVLGRVLVGGIIATTDMSTGPAQPQMQPRAADLQAFLAAERARRDLANGVHVGAGLRHREACPTS